MTNTFSLSQLGWQAFFQQQLSLEEWENYVAWRVLAQHRATLELISECGFFTLALTPNMPNLTVGDWLLLDLDFKFVRALDRLSLFARKAAGSKIQRQSIAANIDTVFIVSSLNHDFNLSRLERYLALAKGAQVEPVVVLTKLDCCEEAESYVQQAQSLDPMLIVVAVNGLDVSSVNTLSPWCRSGKTLAFMGSSGVGKSTLVNTLLGEGEQDTGGVRDDDSKGRHTTTARSLHPMPSGGLLLDTPGMRELQLTDCEDGVHEAFADISELAQSCKFQDCCHQQEPGCHVKAAVEAGTIDARRLNNYLKLLREQAFNDASIAERRATSRSLGRFYRSVQTETKQRKNK